MKTKENLFYQNDNLNGQSQCYGCKQKVSGTFVGLV